MGIIRVEVPAETVEFEDERLQQMLEKVSPDALGES